jgi:hypothetical protein
MNLLEECAALNDDELEAALKFHAEREKHNLAKLLAHMAEYDRRQLCAKRGHSTLFYYCLNTLGFDEGGAFRRIRAARVARQWPEVLDLIEKGRLHLTALIVLSPLLTDRNRKDIFQLAQGKTRRDLEAIVAERLPKSPQSDFARRMPVAGGWSIAVSSPPQAIDALPSKNVASVSSAEPPQVPPVAANAAGPGARPWEWQAMVPISIDRIRIGFDAAIAVMHLIDRARQVLRHKYPEGRLEDVMKEALEILLDRKDPQRRLTLKPAAVVRESTPEEKPAQPRFLRGLTSGRYIPVWVKRAVWERDAGRCAWRFDDGTLCGSKDWIEYDHVRPFAKGGRSDTPRNVRLLCRLHNGAAAAAEGLSAGRAAS